MQVLLDNNAPEVIVPSDTVDYWETHDVQLMQATIGANFKDPPIKPLSKKKRVKPGIKPGHRDVAYDADLPAFVARTIPPREARTRKDCEDVVHAEYDK